MNRLGVVIVTYNRLDLLKICIEHALNQTLPFERIVVVNNNSDDGTKEYLESLKNNLDIITLNKNIGGSGGFYTGIDYICKTNVDWILLIDDDAILDYTFNEKIWFSHYINDKIKAYSGTVKVANTIDYNLRKKLINNRNFVMKNIDENLYEREYFDCDIATFCGLYINKEIILEIGLPIKDFFIWYDDIEYSLRLKRKTTIRNINSAIIDHRCSMSNNTNQITWKEYYGRRNKLYILKKHFSKYAYFKYCMWLFFAFLKHKSKYILKHDKSSQYNANICRDALIDGFNNRLGKQIKYLPK